MDTISSALLLGQSTASSFERQAKTLIKASEANVARIDSQMRDLMRLRDQERGLITALKLVIAPIRKLPAELLVEIFMHVVDDHPGGSTKGVLVLCGVCAHWKRLACTTPQFWTNVPLRQGKPCSDADLAITKGFLERSASLPIPVFLNNRVAPPLVDLMFTVAPRWLSLHLDSVKSSLSKLRNLPSNVLESLESINLTIRARVDEYTPKVVVFLGAPRLRTVYLDVPNPNLIPMPWSQLTHLTLSEEPTAQICLDVLLQCTNIVVATFTGMFSWVVSPNVASIVTLPRLVDLHVEFELSEGDQVMPFFWRLDLPSLRRLEVKVDLDDSWTSTDFTQFQRRSPNITDLKIRNCSFPPADLISTLLESPNLVKLELELCFNCIDDSLFEFLEYSPLEATHPVPKLRQLEISHAESAFSESALENMIRSRWWSDAELRAMPLPPAVERLKSLHIWKEDGSFSQDLQAEMALLRLQGLKVELS
jgi:hypothetical protein